MKPSKTKKHETQLKYRAQLYVDMIMDLIGELPPENEVAQEAHRTIMMYKEYWGK